MKEAYRGPHEGVYVGSPWGLRRNPGPSCFGGGGGLFHVPTGPRECPCRGDGWVGTAQLPGGSQTSSYLSLPELTMKTMDTKLVK